MKKYICSNCGFRNRFQVRTTKHEKTGVNHKSCKNCGAVVFKSKPVLESMMRIDITKHILNTN